MSGLFLLSRSPQSTKVRPSHLFPSLSPASMEEKGQGRDGKEVPMSQTYPARGWSTREWGWSRSPSITTVYSGIPCQADPKRVASTCPATPSVQYRFLPSQSTAIQSDLTPEMHPRGSTCVGNSYMVLWHNASNTGPSIPGALAPPNLAPTNTSPHKGSQLGTPLQPGECTLGKASPVNPMLPQSTFHQCAFLSRVEVLPADALCG